MTETSFRQAELFRPDISKDEAIEQSQAEPTLIVKKPEIVTSTGIQRKTGGNGLIVPGQAADLSKVMPEDIAERIKIQRTLDELSLAFRGEFSPVRLLDKTSSPDIISPSHTQEELDALVHEDDPFTRTELAELTQKIIVKMHENLESFIGYAMDAENGKHVEIAFKRIVIAISEMHGLYEKVCQDPSEVPEKVKEQVIKLFEIALENQTKEITDQSSHESAKNRIRSTFEFYLDSVANTAHGANIAQR